MPRLPHGKVITPEQFRDARVRLAERSADIDLAFAATAPVDLQDFDFLFPTLQHACATVTRPWLPKLRAALAVLCSTLVLIAAPSLAQAATSVKKLPPVLYTAFDGHTETLAPWQGRYVSVLIEQGITRDPTVMAKLVGALDRAWRYYHVTTGQLPAPASSPNGVHGYVREIREISGPYHGIKRTLSMIRTRQENFLHYPGESQKAS
jgi:hypothetical protein